MAILTPLAFIAVPAAAGAAVTSLARSRVFRVDWGELATWLDTTTPTATAVGLALPVAAILTGYLLGAGALYLLALGSRVPRAVRVVARITPAAVRVLAERAVATSLLTATLAAPTAAAADTADPGTLPPGLRVLVTAEDTEPLPQVAPPRTPAPGPVTDRVIARDQVTVEPGDHLWGIAARAVAAAAGVAASQVPTAVVAGYWREVVRVNTPHLRSGDPDLIHPGEVVRLPPLPDAAG